MIQKLIALAVSTIALLGALHLPAHAQAAGSFYPLATGDYWIYADYAWGHAGVWDTITTRVTGDTIIAGHSCFIKASRSWRYGNSWSTFERIDSAGNAVFVNPATGQETLNYRLSDTSRTWWTATGYVQRFDSTVAASLFGAPRSLMYVGAYTVKDSAGDTVIISSRILIDGIGFCTTLMYGIFDGDTPALVGGRVSGTSFGIVTSVDRRHSATVPSGFRLERPFPNPFNPSTTLTYSIPVSSRVSMEISDAAGKKVAVLRDAVQSPGVYTVSWNGSGCASGIYFCRMFSGGAMLTQRLLLLK